MAFQIDKNRRTIRMKNNTLNLYDYFNSKGFFFSKEVLLKYYLSLKTKPFVILSGISGTGKTKIAQLFASYICQGDEKNEAEKRVAFVSVRPDWMDNKGLLGYYNILDEKYHSTNVLDLLLEAQEHPGKPYFVILDEMNLAKVEHYFSDFLSVLESRTPDNPNGEAIQLHSLKQAESLDGRSIPGTLHIPTNIFFAGTVNVDESTYMFSPKVLDRANVIEFNDVDLDGYAKGGQNKGNLFLRNAEVLNSFYDPSEQQRFCRKLDYDQLPEDGKIALNNLLAILKEHNLHFGYRVANELGRFVNLAAEELADFKLDEAVDIQIIQKILPKLHGTRAKLEEPLRKLIAFCCRSASPVSDEQVKKARSYDPDARFPRSAQKIAQMLHQLSIQGYVSFIE
jgi:5-methylcytosine-specific restriction endonuclease McrBC GTP-binding regulatory subunit McrB